MSSWARALFALSPSLPLSLPPPLSPQMPLSLLSLCGLGRDDRFPVNVAPMLLLTPEARALPSTCTCPQAVPWAPLPLHALLRRSCRPACCLPRTPIPRFLGTGSPHLYSSLPLPASLPVLPTSPERAQLHHLGPFIFLSSADLKSLGCRRSGRGRVVFPATSKPLRGAQCTRRTPASNVPDSGAGTRRARGAGRLQQEVEGLQRVPWMPLEGRGQMPGREGQRWCLAGGSGREEQDAQVPPHGRKAGTTAMTAMRGQPIRGPLSPPPPREGSPISGLPLWASGRLTGP